MIVTQKMLKIMEEGNESHSHGAQSQPINLLMLNLTAKTLTIDLQRVSESLTPVNKIQARPEQGSIAVLSVQYFCFHPAC